MYCPNCGCQVFEEVDLPGYGCPECGWVGDQPLTAQRCWTCNKVLDDDNYFCKECLGIIGEPVTKSGILEEYAKRKGVPVHRIWPSRTVLDDLMDLPIVDND